MKTIEYKICAWEECNDQFIPHHGNQKYCSKECYKAAKLKRDREQKKVVSTSKKALTTADENHPSTTMALYQRDLQKLESERFLRQAISPFFLEVNNRLARIETNQAEFQTRVVNNPETLRRLLARAEVFQEAVRMLKAFGELTELYKIRRELEYRFQISKQTAERILKEAVKHIQQENDKNQRSLGDYT